MNVKNIVKVMNFHSLLRVDKSRKSAKKYAYLGDTVADMIDNIVNNRNILLDFKMLKVDETKPELHIYLGSDMGFCANLNSNVNKVLWEDEDAYKIIVGRKLHAKQDDDKVIMTIAREDFSNNIEPTFEIIKDAFINKKYAKICLIYNHYYSASEVEFTKKQLYPMPQHLRSENNYSEDFAYEGEIEQLLLNLIILYMKYEIIVAEEVSNAAVNITRQNTTNESLKKITEREEKRAMLELKENREREFGKVLDNYTKLNSY